jgi:H+/Cl- antiporter ClcA
VQVFYIHFNFVGVTNYCLPLTIGSGSTLLSAFPTVYLQGNISNYIMISSAFAKMALLTISMNCGFIGGFIYPMITIATICGLVCNNMYPGIPLGMTLACFMAALPSSLAPMPYTFCSLFSLIFSLGPYQASTVFVSGLTAYTLVSGSGILQYMQKKAAEREAQSAAAAELAKKNASVTREDDATSISR